MTVFAEVYDRVFADKDYAREAKVTHQLLGSDARRVLEVGCGTGNHSAALAACGLRVVACDTDEEMLDVAVSKRLDDVRLYPGPVDALPSFHGDFDGAVALFDVVNYCLDFDALTSLFRAVRERLRPGAPFVFDAWHGELLAFDPPATRFTPRRLSVPTLTWPDQVRVDLYAASDDDLVHHRVELRAWSVAAIRASAREAGMVDLQAFGWLETDRPPSLLLDRKVIYRCRRPTS